ncbi:MAG: hypothetical protein IJP77_01855 [Bacteroidales bacterium]|nr:hypothetical protein [Bacteroidales bacterium]
MRRSLFCLLALLLLLPASLYAQDVREGTLGIRLDGGLSWSLGGDFANSGKNALTTIQPQGIVGLFYNFSPRFRVGLDYGYTRMVRQQLDGTMHALPGGGEGGEVYRDLKNHFHAAELTGEFNLLGEGPLSLYLGAGAGCQFVVGNTYTIAVKNEVKPGGMGNTIHVTGHNVGHKFAAPYIPVTLSLEYAFLPQVAVSMGGGYRLILAGKNGFSAKSQPFATLGLRFNLSK